MLTATPQTLSELLALFEHALQRDIHAGLRRPATLCYYRRFLHDFRDHVGGDRLLDSFVPLELELWKTNWHSVQAVQRLWNWAVKMGVLKCNPFTKIDKPPLGERQRVLTRPELARLLWSAGRDFRRFLIFMRHSLARPQEVRSLCWSQLHWLPVPVFRLQEFKAKARRKDRSAVRLILLDDYLARMLARWWQRGPEKNSFILCNSQGQPWSGNAIRLRMKRLRRRLGLTPDEAGESVVTYTIRHTGATWATAAGVRDRQLADLLGHTTTRTTARYQHLQVQDLHRAAAQIHTRHRLVPLRLANG